MAEEPPTVSTSVPSDSRTWTVLPLVGDVDLASAPALRQQLADMTTESPSFLVIDMSELDFIDSTGLGVLVGTLRRLRATGGDVRLAAARTGIARVFSVTGLDRVFSLYPTVEAASADPREPEAL
ncbi:MAG: STAS domain-containing protein [Acidimicrobiales bacterium]